MDIVTQGLLGATLALSASKPKQQRLAAAIGFAAAVLTDADILIRSTEDTLLNVEFHRQFTHSLIFIPVGALLAALLLWPLLRRRLEFKRIYFYALLGYATSGLLDATTSFGTHLLWPFSDVRTAWSIIAIIDPVFSLILLITAGWGVSRYRTAPARIGLTLAAGYLLLGAWQHQQARGLALELASQRGHPVERLIVKPTMANLLLWRSVYESAGQFHVDAVRVGLFGSRRIYPGATANRFDVRRDLPNIEPGSVLYRDIERFSYFADGFVAADPSRERVLTDIRYSMLPIHVTPMWGIDLNVASLSEHARFTVYRDRDANMRALFIAMLLGRDLPG